MEAVGIKLPKLPELDKADIKAVRSFLPGKLLSRTAALLALAVLVLGFAGLVEQELKRLLDVDLARPHGSITRCSLRCLCLPSPPNWSSNGAPSLAGALCNGSRLCPASNNRAISASARI